jgi:hypothetical protein
MTYDITIHRLTSIPRSNLETLHHHIIPIDGGDSSKVHPSSTIYIALALPIFSGVWVAGFGREAAIVEDELEGVVHLDALKP